MSKKRKKLSKEEILARLNKFPNQTTFDSERVGELFANLIDTSDLKEEDLDFPESIEALQLRLKKTLVDNIDKVLKELENILDPESDEFDDVIILRGRYKHFRNAQKRGLMSFEEEGREVRLIMNQSLVTISTLDFAILK